MEVRKVQEIKGSIYVGIPAEYAIELNLKKADVLQAVLEKDTLLFRRLSPPILKNVLRE